MEEKVTMRLKRSFSNHWLMGRLNLSSDDVRNCKETTIHSLKNVRRTESSNWRINKSKEI